MAFQEDGIEEHSIDNMDDVLGPLNVSNGGSMDVDGRHDSALENELNQIVKLKIKKNEEAKYISNNNEL